MPQLLIKNKNLPFKDLGDSSYIAAALDLFLLTPSLLKKVELLKKSPLLPAQQKFLKLIDDLRGQRDFSNAWEELVQIVKSSMVAKGFKMFYQDEVLIYQLFQDWLQIKPSIQYQQVTKYSSYQHMPTRSVFKRIGDLTRVLSLSLYQSLEDLITKENTATNTYHPLNCSGELTAIPTTISKYYLIPQEQEFLAIQVGSVLINILTLDFKINQFLIYTHPHHQQNITYVLYGLTFFHSNDKRTEFISIIRDNNGWICSRDEHLTQMTNIEVQQLIDTSLYTPSLLLYINLNQFEFDPPYFEHDFFYRKKEHVTLFDIFESDDSLSHHDSDAIQSKNIFEQELSFMFELKEPEFVLDGLNFIEKLDEDQEFEESVLKEAANIKHTFGLLSAQPETIIFNREHERLENSINQHCLLLEKKAKKSIFFSEDTIVQKTIDSLRELNLIKEISVKIKERLEG